MTGLFVCLSVFRSAATNKVIIARMISNIRTRYALREEVEVEVEDMYVCRSVSPPTS